MLNKWQLSQEISKQLPQSTVSVRSYSNMLTAFPTVGLRTPHSRASVGNLALGTQSISKWVRCSQFANAEQQSDNAL